MENRKRGGREREGGEASGSCGGPWRLPDGWIFFSLVVGNRIVVARVSI